MPTIRNGQTVAGPGEPGYYAPFSEDPAEGAERLVRHSAYRQHCEYRTWWEDEWGNRYVAPTDYYFMNTERKEAHFRYWLERAGGGVYLCTERGFRGRQYRRNDAGRLVPLTNPDRGEGDYPFETVDEVMIAYSFHGFVGGTDHKRLLGVAAIEGGDDEEMNEGMNGYWQALWDCANGVMARSVAELKGVLAHKLPAATAGENDDEGFINKVVFEQQIIAQMNGYREFVRNYLPDMLPPLLVGQLARADPL